MPIASQLQLRRGTTPQHAVFTGAPAEVTVDTDKKTIVVHDGTTQGGFPLALDSVLASGSITARTLSDRFAETVKVADFGAVGDGVNDDAAAIQAAITYAISRGNAVIEFEPKTYRLTSVKPIATGVIWPMQVNRNHLEIHGGTPSTRLSFRGNGARLYTDVNQSGNTQTTAYFFVVASELHSLEFYDITFERGPQTVASPMFVSGNAFIAMRPVSSSPIDRVTCNNVTFVNGFSAVIDNRGWGVTRTLKQLKLVEWKNCKHLHPRGGNSTQVYGGGQMLNLSAWIDTFAADGVYVDGAVGGKIPNDVFNPVDGWNYVNAFHEHITNSSFKNCGIETVILGELPLGFLKCNSFVQPAINSNVTLTVSSDQLGIIANENIIVGKKYGIGDSSSAKTWSPNFVGVYEIVSASQNLQTGSQIVVKRTDDKYLLKEDSGIPSLGSFVSAGTTITLPELAVLEIGGPPSSSVTNCSFSMDSESGIITRENNSIVIDKIEITNGGSGYASAPDVIFSTGSATAIASVSNGAVVSVQINSFDHYLEPPIIQFSGGGGNGATAIAKLGNIRHNPAIDIRGGFSSISNCHISDAATFISVEQKSYGYQSSSIITNNSFINLRSIPSFVSKPSQLLITTMADTLIANNLFSVIDKNECNSILYCVRSGLRVLNNVFKCQTPSQNNDGFAAIFIGDSAGNAEWNMYIDNNMFYGFNFGVTGNVPTVLGQMLGSFVTKPVNQGGSRSKLKLVSPNGNLWTAQITNDGEIELLT